MPVVSKRKQPKTFVEQFPNIGNLVDSIGLYQLSQAYLQDLAVKNYSQATIENKELYLYLFLDWAGQRGLIRPTEINRPILERYQRHLFHYRKNNGEPLSYHSQRNRLTTLRAWFKWLSKHNYILYNPASEIELPKLEKRLPRSILSESDVETIINAIDINDHMGMRDRAILEVLYSTGIRRLEVVNLMVQDIDIERGTLFVRKGKGRKDRMIPIGARALLWVEKYLETRAELLSVADEGILFLIGLTH